MRSILISLSGLVSIITLCAQKGIPIRYEKNMLQFPGGTDSFETFWQKLDSLIYTGKGQIHIMHIGGSHVQADFWTGKMRQLFQKSVMGGDGPRGLVFPYKIAKTNSPYNYSSSYTGKWKTCKISLVKKPCPNAGILGYNATTYDSNATFKIFFRYGETYPFTAIRIFYLDDSLSFLPVPDLPDSLIIDTFKGKGYIQYSFKKPLETIEIKLQKTDSLQKRFSLMGLQLMSDEAGIVVHNVGVNGASVKSYLKADFFIDQIKIVKPDLIIFSIGINDTHEDDFSFETYTARYDSLIKAIKQVVPDVQIIFTTNNDSYYRRRYPNKRAYVVQKAMWHLAKKYHAGYWDMFEIMGGLGSSWDWWLAGYMQRDKIHFTKKGYFLIGELLFMAIMNAYGDHLRKVERVD